MLVKAGTDLHAAAVMQHETRMVLCMFMNYGWVASTNCTQPATMLCTAQRTIFCRFIAPYTKGICCTVEARLWRSVKVNLHLSIWEVFGKMSTAESAASWMKVLFF